MKKISQGIYLQSAEELISEQKGWHDLDESKNVDFTTSPFWVTTDDGQGPYAVADEKEALGLVEGES